MIESILHLFTIVEINLRKKDLVNIIHNMASAEWMNEKK